MSVSWSWDQRLYQKSTVWVGKASHDDLLVDNNFTGPKV